MSEALLVDHEGDVCIVRLARPDQRNAIDLDTCRALDTLLWETAAKRSARALVLTGEGSDFCTGADAVRSNKPVEETSALDYRWITADYNRLFQTLWQLELPVISAVNGTVAGAGWLLALLADLVVAAEGAKWTHVFARRGMLPHAGDPYYLPRVISFHRLNELVMLGDSVTSETLAGWGAVNRLVPRDRVLPTALELAARLAAGPTRSLGIAKRLYRRSLESTLHGAYEEEAAALALVSTTQDRLEGVQSFIEGRKPAFRGE